MLNRTSYIIFSLILVIITLLSEQYTNYDMLISAKFYNVIQHKWDINIPIHYTLSPFFYSGIKEFTAFCGTLAALTILFSLRYPFLRQYTIGCAILLLSTIIIPIIIGQIKTYTNIYCPNLLNNFDGFIPYKHVFESFPANFSFSHPGRCFPASHPSGPFSLMSSYFIFKDKFNQSIAILFSFSLGIIASLYQIMRGEHFISHCIISFCISIIIIVIIEKAVKKVAPYFLLQKFK